jgi:N-methylhydantoinase A
VTTMRLRATGVVRKPTLPRLESRAGSTPRSDGTRPVYLSEEQPSVLYTLYTRESLRAGDEIDGPAIISEHTATTVIHARDRLKVGEYGEMVITVSTESEA